jgi:DNA-binding IclR family transcriptional regulator
MSRELDVEIVAFVRAGADVLCVARADATPGRRATVQVGQRIPLMAPLSSVYVAWAPPDEVEAWLLRGGAPLRERRRQRDILRRVRSRGYSVALEVAGRRQLGELLGELVEDPRSDALRREMRRVIQELGLGRYQRDDDAAPSWISSITAPVFDGQGGVVLSLTLQVIEKRLSSASIEAFGQRLLRATRALVSR